MILLPLFLFCFNNIILNYFLFFIFFVQKYTISKSTGNCLKIINSERKAGVERCVGCITVPAGRYRLLRNGLEGAYRDWQEKTRPTQP